MNGTASILRFVKELEHLKSITRTAWTSTGRQESTAEHSWRLALFAGLICEQLPDYDRETILMTSLVHDLGEIYSGDISAALKPDSEQKYAVEARDINRLFSYLEEPERTKLLTLWQDYENGSTKEARLVRALDKAETIIQHNQGINPPDFDYSFNLQYGSTYFEEPEFLRELRTQIDEDTKVRIAAQDLASSETDAGKADEEDCNE